ncbi:pfaD family domain protein [Burkholderia mallei]|nr:pfaD family domain protein [Burkholderia pseudomallei]KOT16308.1 pfaD family domain protein [Burkholderia mallei]BEH33395.1 hypothetical protein GTC054_46110 [Burkholderia pseudomallei]
MRGECLLRGPHEFRVERAAGIEPQIPHPIVLEQRLGPRDFVGGAGDDELRRRVVVRDRGIDEAVLVERALDLLAARVDDRGHRAVAGLAHQLCAPGDELQAGLEVEAARREQRVEFAQAVAGEKIGRLAAVLAFRVVRQGIDDV